MHATALPLSVTMAVLLAALTHATWNAIAHGIFYNLLLMRSYREPFGRVRIAAAMLVTAGILLLEIR